MVACAHQATMTTVCTLHRAPRATTRLPSNGAASRHPQLQPQPQQPQQLLVPARRRTVLSGRRSAPSTVPAAAWRGAGGPRVCAGGVGKMLKKAGGIYAEFDKDGDRELSLEETVQLLNSPEYEELFACIGVEVPTRTLEDLRPLFEKMDSDGSGGLSRKEFVMMWGSLAKDRISEPKVLDAVAPRSRIGDVLRKVSSLYSKFDEDGNGELSLEEMVQLLNSPEYEELFACIGIEVPPRTLEEVRPLFEKLDSDGSGALSRKEFVMMWATLAKDRCLEEPKVLAKVASQTRIGNMLKQISDLYVKVDKDTNGELSLEETVHLLNSQEYEDLMSSMGIEVPTRTLEELNPLYEELDADGSGGLSRKEFVVMWASLAKDRCLEEPKVLALALCSALDKNGDGKLQASELKRFLPMVLGVHAMPLKFVLKKLLPVPSWTVVDYKNVLS